MALDIRLNGNSDIEGFLLAPSGNVTFPVPLALRNTNQSEVPVEISISPGGAGIELSTRSLSVGPEKKVVELQAVTSSLRRNDTVVRIFDGSRTLQSSARQP